MLLILLTPSPLNKFIFSNSTLSSYHLPCWAPPKLHQINKTSLQFVCIPANIISPLLQLLLNLLPILCYGPSGSCIWVYLTNCCIESFTCFIAFHATTAYLSTERKVWHSWSGFRCWNVVHNTGKIYFAWTLPIFSPSLYLLYLSQACTIYKKYGKISVRITHSWFYLILYSSTDICHSYTSSLLGLEVCLCKHKSFL